MNEVFPKGTSGKQRRRVAFHYPPPPKAEPEAPVLAAEGQTLRNRRMRTRMSGGVGTGRVNAPGYPIGRFFILVPASFA